MYFLLSRNIEIKIKVLTTDQPLVFGAWTLILIRHLKNLFDIKPGTAEEDLWPVRKHLLPGQPPEGVLSFFPSFHG